ncbi:MAG TPA: hypothetical protein DHU74_07000 [Clostridiales bacterium]|nr:hypothetical protein [Clostridiales bacterium]
MVSRTLFPSYTPAAEGAAAGVVLNRKVNTVDTYFISEKCVGCGGCHSRCPVGCIDATKKPLIIDNNRCIGCGACYLACPIRAVIKR